ncbi:MAG TPA: TetR family transcriptional regulator [Acidimicrobiia bacterium]|jgi:AcrR family transcriptional regulator
MASTTAPGNGRARTGGRAAETEARKRRILAAAARLARRGGYDAVQMRDVAADAEVALGTLYRHYTSKDQLLLAMQLDQTQTLRRRLELHPPDGESAADRVADVLRRACKGLERDPLVTGAMVRAMFAPEPDVIGVKRSVQEQLHSIIESAIAPEHTASAGAGEASVDAVVDVLGHVWFAAIAFWVNGLTDGTAMADRLASTAHLLLE